MTAIQAPMTFIQRAILVDCLRKLADREYQEQVWIRGEGPEVGDHSITALLDQLFVDTGLLDLIDRDEVAGAVGSAVATELAKLYRLLDTIQGVPDVAEVLRLPTWAEVMSTAGRAADLLVNEPDTP